MTTNLPIMNLRRDVDDFTRGYITCALWLSNDESTPSGGEPMDRNYTWTDIAEESLQKIVEDCAKFQAANEELLGQYYTELPGRGEWTRAERAGHDFWLSRNGHGAGFFDRDVPDEIKDRLQELARQAGTSDLYIGDDGKIYCSP